MYNKNIINMQSKLLKKYNPDKNFSFVKKDEDYCYIVHEGYVLLRLKKEDCFVDYGKYESKIDFEKNFFDKLKDAKDCNLCFEKKAEIEGKNETLVCFMNGNDKFYVNKKYLSLVDNNSPIYKIVDNYLFVSDSIGSYTALVMRVKYND